MFNARKPTTDFSAVRDGRLSPWYSYEIDLSVARFDAPSQDLILPIAGNSFYVDRAPDVGNAQVQFQDVNFDRSMLPVYASPGFIASVPFTQIKITNISQPGKVLRIFYGVDVDFYAGSTSQVTFTGKVDINGAILNASLYFPSLAAGPNLVIAPAANTAGIVLANLLASSVATSGGAFTVLAKSTVPANMSDGDVLGSSLYIPSSVNTYNNFQLINPVFISSGKGVYIFITPGSTGLSCNASANWQQ